MTFKNLLRFLLVFLFLLFIVFGSFSAFCGLSAYKTFNSIVSQNSEGFNKNYQTIRKCSGNNVFIEKLPKFLSNKHYLVLFLNNAEIRPGGGFMGSYANIQFKNNVLQSWEIEDIYIPDGQLPGHVDPPLPLQQAFRTGDWKLRNANWHPDFPTAAKDIVWFFEKGKVENVDGLIVFNLGLVNKWLGIVGPIKLDNYPELINSDNFATLAQMYAEDFFFPGSRSKQDFLGSVGKSLLVKTLNAGAVQKAKLAKLIYSELNNQQIILWNKESELQNFIVGQNWGGDLGSYETDYFYSLESNLGANKANYFVERNIIQHITTTSDKFTSLTELTWQNKHDEKDSKSKWSGDYINYERIIIPKDSTVKNIEVNGNILTLDNNKDFFNLPELKEDQTYTEELWEDFKIIGFWVVIPKESALTARIKYEGGIVGKDYSLIFKRQPGIYNLPYKLFVNDKEVVDTKLQEDYFAN